LTRDKVLEAHVRRLVDSGTFARGSAYADGGAVLEHRWIEGDVRLLGAVKGSGRNSYVTSVTIARSVAGEVIDIGGSCSCPVAFNCKHVVALVLTAESGDHQTGRGQARTGAARPPPWERTLRRIAGDLSPGDPDGPSPLGLQFELSAPAAPRGNGSVSAARIRLRPVTPGRNGSWVKTVVSWSNLDYFWHRGASDERTAEQIALLKELLALSRVQVSRYYSRYNDEGVWLESINSRRVWDLLAEAEVLGLPLVGAGRRPSHVTLCPVRGEARMDVTRTPEGIDIQPRVVVGDIEVPTGTALLVGSPAHGIAWWTVVPDADTPGHLFLAALISTLDGALGDLVMGEAIPVPAQDEGRFLGEFHPLLSERVAVTSSDGSVDLPEPAPRHLELSVSSPDGTRCLFGWSWVRGSAELGRRAGLWSSTGRPEERQSEADLVAAVTSAVVDSPHLVESDELGARLVADGVLSGMAAVDFVTRILPALEELDGVEVALIGDLPGFRAADDAPVVALAGTGSTDRGDWFDLMVTVSVDDEDVPFRDLFVALAEGRTHLILPSGTYFPLDGDELRRLADLIIEGRSLWEAPNGAIRVSRFQAAWWEEMRTLGVISARVAEWESSVRTLIDAGDRVEHSVPAGLQADLRHYQRDGFNWLAYLYDHGLGGILADDMGLGKTVQALALICHVHERNPAGPPFLVIAPTSVVQNWEAECRKFAPGLDVVAIRETATRRGVPLSEAVAGADIVVTSYGLFRREFDEYDAVEWAGLFLDEAQFVKNHTSQSHRRARMLAVPFKVAVTGTPMENNLMELWSLLAITAPGLMGDAKRFTTYYRNPVEREADAERLAQLRRRIRPLMLRRTKEQVAADLPAKLEQVLELELVPRHAKVYQAYLQRERQKVLGMLGDMRKHRFEIFRSLTLLRQASLDVGLVDEKHAGVPSTKLDALMEMVEEVVADGHRVLVFSQFTRFLQSARSRVESSGIDLCYLDGRTRNRTKVIDRFQNGEAPVFLVSLKAGGFGLNLTAADYCILLDPWWNPATEAQAVDRTHRIGQTKKVMVYRMVAKDTIEEKVMAMKAKKAALFANVIDSGELASGALTAEDIRSLIE
jgi:superfamily II DNA or RNA helicase